MRTYDQLMDSILATIPTHDEVAALTEQQISTLRGALNGTDNVLYMQTAAWRKFKAETAAMVRHCPQCGERSPGAGHGQDCAVTKLPPARPDEIDGSRS